jgi:hypothetical protein
VIVSHGLRAWTLIPLETRYARAPAPLTFSLIHKLIRKPGDVPCFLFPFCFTDFLCTRAVEQGRMGHPHSTISSPDPLAYHAYRG